MISSRHTGTMDQKNFPSIQDIILNWDYYEISRAIAKGEGPIKDLPTVPHQFTSAEVRHHIIEEDSSFLYTHLYQTTPIPTKILLTGICPHIRTTPPRRILCCLTLWSRNGRPSPPPNLRPSRTHRAPQFLWYPLQSHP